MMLRFHYFEIKCINNEEFHRPLQVPVLEFVTHFSSHRTKQQDAILVTIRCVTTTDCFKNRGIETCSIATSLVKRKRKRKSQSKSIIVSQIAKLT